MYHASVNVNLIKEKVIEINGGITANIDTGEKIIIYVRKTIFGTLLHVVSKMVNI